MTLNISHLIIPFSLRSINPTVFNQCHPNDDGPEAVQLSLRLAPNGRPDQASSVLIPERSKTTPVKNSVVPRILAIKNQPPSGPLGASSQPPWLSCCRANHTNPEAITSSISARTAPASRPANGVKIRCLNLFIGCLTHVVPCMEV